MNDGIALNPEDLSLFDEVATAIHTAHNFEHMLGDILHRIKQGLQSEGASLALHEKDQQRFYFIRTVEMAQGDATPGTQQLHFPDHVGIAGWVLRNNETVLIPDASQDDRVYRGFDLAEQHPTRSMICVPLRTPKGIIGVLYAINKLVDTFTLKESILLEILAVTIAMAIENAQLYGELQAHANALETENLRLLSEIQNRFEAQGMIGSSPAMQKVFDLLTHVISTDTSVLIQGETGTGKELIARIIHYNGNRKDKPFVAENCGALTESLLESELFGHVKGAFTGAVADKKGLFEMAHGGTVLLDEIGEMPTAMQVKLLRVLQEGQLRPVGSSQSVRVNVRLITCTNRDLEQAVRQGSFREDLYYRIAVFPITIPPLRERQSDIPLLATHFLEEYAMKFQRTVPRLLPAALDKLTRYAWPGNVRELQNEMERAVTLAGNDVVINLDYLSAKIRAGGSESLVAIPKQGALQEVVAQLEQQMVTEALQKSHGNRSRAARALGLSRQGLLNKISRYKIEV